MCILKFVQHFPFSNRPLIVYTMIVGIDTAVDGVYTCEVMDHAGKVYTKTVTVTVIGKFELLRR